MMGVYGKRCLRPGCTGRVTFEVGLAGVDRDVVCSRDLLVLGYTAVQSAQVLRIPFRRGCCTEMFARART